MFVYDVFNAVILHRFFLFVFLSVISATQELQVRTLLELRCAGICLCLLANLYYKIIS